MRTQVIDVGVRVAKQKWQWVEHVCRRDDDRSQRALFWRTRLRRQNVGRPPGRPPEMVERWLGRPRTESPQMKNSGDIPTQQWNR